MLERRLSSFLAPSALTCSAELKKQVLPRLTRPGIGGWEVEVDGEAPGTASEVEGSPAAALPFFPLLLPLLLPFPPPLPFLGLAMA